MRQADAIVEAAIRCLGRDGFAASSLQRIADEAKVNKRSLLYYFDDREDLFEHVVRRIGDRLLAQVADAVAGRKEPSEIVSAGFEEVWAVVTSDRALLAAYFGLVAESVTDPTLRASTAHITDGFRSIIGGLIADAAERGRRPVIDPTVLTEFVVAGIQGLTLTFLERGETPELMGTIDAFRSWLGTVLP
jgi:AcrR family transcriptional regulator